MASAMLRRLEWSPSPELAGVEEDVALVEAIALYGGFVSVDTGKEDGVMMMRLLSC